MTVNSLFYFIESVMEDVRLNDWAKLDISESGTREIMKAFDYINYINVRLPTNNDLITVPDVEVPYYSSRWGSSRFY